MKLLAALPLLFMASFMVHAAECRTFLDGSTYCTGPQGYQASGREYQGGYSEYQDNRGNTAQIRQHTGGVTSINAPTGIVPQVQPAPRYEHQTYPNIYPRIYPK